jgi:hypothetical protein
MTNIDIGDLVVASSGRWAFVGENGDEIKYFIWKPGEVGIVVDIEREEEGRVFCIIIVRGCQLRFNDQCLTRLSQRI